MSDLLRYLEQAHSITILLDIGEIEGRPISDYTFGGADKTRMARIKEAEKVGLVAIHDGYQYNAKKVNLTDKGRALLHLIQAISYWP